MKTLFNILIFKIYLLPIVGINYFSSQTISTKDFKVRQLIVRNDVKTRMSLTADLHLFSSVKQNQLNSDDVF